ncbi:hypothetical protein BKA70DRAFT_1491808 [Coprinopsis sp. MPI-PUGE-AT-0042]|nr:hypothetical protein BKA70DRAFT_1491808 [Coprinopsis sp. MPI-PUGE-AT-0042]
MFNGKDRPKFSSPPWCYADFQPCGVTQTKFLTLGILPWLATMINVAPDNVFMTHMVEYDNSYQRDRPGKHPLRLRRGLRGCDDDVPMHISESMMDLETETLVRSNDGIPASLSATCLEQLRDLEASVTVIDGKISVLEDESQSLLSTLEALKGEKLKLNERMSTLKSLLAPIRKLPNELLANIFQSPMDQGALMNERDREMLTTIRRVCKRWDSVARETPGLWRNLHLGVEEQLKSTEVLATRLSTWLSRGGVGAPLRLSIGCAIHPYSESVHPSFKDFITSPWNWSEIHLRLGITCLLTLLEAVAEKDFKPWRSLKRLALDILSGNDVDLDLGHQALPALDHLHLSFTCLGWLWQINPIFVPSIRVSHPSVTTLCLAQTAVTDHGWLPAFLNAEHFPALQTLVLQDLYFIGQAATAPPTSRPTVLAVERLIVQGDVSLLALDYLTLPLGKIIKNLKACHTLQIPRLVSFAPFSSHESPLVQTIICKSPIFELADDGHVNWIVEEELIGHVRHRSRASGTPSLTIVSPDPGGIPGKQYWNEGCWQEINSLVEGGWLKFLQTVDDLDPDEATLLKPYKTEGSFAAWHLVAASDD